MRTRHRLTLTTSPQRGRANSQDERHQARACYLVLEHKAEFVLGSYLFTDKGVHYQRLDVRLPTEKQASTSQVSHNV